MPPMHVDFAVFGETEFELRERAEKVMDNFLTHREGIGTSPPYTMDVHPAVTGRDGPVTFVGNIHIELDEEPDGELDTGAYR